MDVTPAWTFKPPPGWPVSNGWTPEAGWEPPADWPVPPEGWQWWEPAKPVAFARAAEVACWLLGLALWDVGLGLALNAAGTDAHSGRPLFNTWLIGFGVIYLGIGIRSVEGTWRRALAIALVGTAVSADILVTLIGPGSGMPGACSPGELCDIDQGLGYVTGPFLLAIPAFAMMLTGRLSRRGWRWMWARGPRNKR